MDHESIKALLPFAALERLEPDEARALDEHLRAGCDECETELRELRETVASMAYALEPVESEQRIWDRLDARLHAASGNQLPRRAAAQAGMVRRPARTHTGLWRAATGAFAAATIGLAIYAGIASNKLNRTQKAAQRRIAELNSQLADTKSELENARGEVRTLQAVIADQTKLQHILMAPDLRLTRLEPLKAAPNAKAIVAISERNNAALIQATGLPPAPSDKVYELWWITKESGPIAAGLFQTQSGHTTIAPASPPPKGQHVMLSAVTLEPLGGVPKPTGAMYLKGTPG